MSVWLYKWLPILFGCHCRPSRSLFYKGKQFPICARCTGELFGLVFGLAAYWWVCPAPGTAVLLLLPLIADGLIQLHTSYESKNGRRLITGILFGYGMISLFLVSIVRVVSLGYQVGLVVKGY